jgi:formylglycine-generating enzyme required for sulfatase activity
LTITDYLENIRDFLDLRLDKFKEIDMLTIEVDESNLGNIDPLEDALILDLGNGVTLELVSVDAGRFMMGSPDDEGDDDEHPQHQVILEKFLIGKYAVTNAQWEAVMKTKGSATCDKKFQGDLKPVVGVTWHESRAFCNMLSKQIGKNVRLPTEAEWEYAARGANQSRGFTYSGSNNLDKVGWYKDNSNGLTHPVGQKISNELGIYDMSGNVWEWCLDEWHDSYKNKSEKLISNGNKPWSDQDEYSHDNRSSLIRGGSCNNIDTNCRPKNRSWKFANSQYINVGFRILLSS